MDEVEYESIIQWCCQKQYYNDMLAFSKQAVDLYSVNDRMRVFLALSFTMNNHLKDAMKEAMSLVIIYNFNFFFFI